MRRPDLARIRAVTASDLRARLRRPGAAALMAGAALAAVLLIPDPGPGRGLVQIDGARALYTSPTLALATATLLALALSLFGFYVVSHALGGDAGARLGTVLAATPVSNLEYLAGKLLGSVALLAGVSCGFLAASMAMQVVRGEGPLQPGAFAAHYAVLAGPCLVWVSMLALLFECVPWLSGRLGDVLYLLVWACSIPLGLLGWKPGGPKLARVLDVMGFGFMVSEVERIAGTRNFTIGFGPIESTRPPVVFPGLSFPLEALGARAASLLAPLLLFPLALALFRRFDPARTRTAVGGRLQVPTEVTRIAGALTRPLLGPLQRLAPDVALTFRARPLVALAVPVIVVLSLSLPPLSVREGLLPVVFAFVSIALADVATREAASGTTAVVFAAPGRREGFAVWKLGSAAVAALLLGGAPALRLLPAEPRSAVSASIGLLLLAFSAVALGIATGTPKTFMAASLALWYLGLNAREAPALDYAGWWAKATPATQAGWLVAAISAAALALGAHRLRLAREG